MYKPKWEKILYKDQKFPNNYMEFSTSTQRLKTVNIKDVNRFVISVSSVFIFFSFHLLIDKIQSDIVINILFIVVIFISYRCINEIGLFKIFTRLASIIIFWVYLLSPIFLTLTKEVDTDTIYLAFVLLQVFYAIDNVKCAILEGDSMKWTKDDMHLTATVVKPKSPSVKGIGSSETEIKILESTETARKVSDFDSLLVKNCIKPRTSKNIYSRPLNLEDTYVNFRKYNRSIFGYCCSLLGSILLSSRLRNVDDVFLHLTTNLVWFILFPLQRESQNLSESVRFVIFFISLCAVLTHIANSHLFYLYLSFFTVTYLSTSVFIYHVNAHQQ